MKVLLTTLLLFAGLTLFALGSTTDSELFILDTVVPALQLTSPIGGEAWYIGDTDNITWNSSDTNLNNDSVFLWYSLNNGVDWTVIVESSQNNGSFIWDIPSTQSTSAKVQVQISDTFGNTALTSSPAFGISYVPPAIPDGVTADTSNGVDAVISWQPVTLTIYGTPITPDGYIVLYNESPYEGDQFYYFLGRSFTTTYTHQDVTEFRSQMFYRVVAYKNYRSEGFAQLELQTKSKKLLWSEARKILQGASK